jgi:hypothetical protein
MGFDASRAMRGLDTQRLPILSLPRELQQHHKMFRSLGGIDRMREFVQGSTARNIETLRSAAMSRGGVYADLVKASGTLIRPYKPPTLSYALSESMRRGLPGIARNLASLTDYSRMQSDVLKPATMLGSLGMSSSIAQAFESHGLASSNIAAWSLRRVPSVRTPALQSFLKSATAFGPIVVSPDYEDEAPFDYHPDLGRLLPKTATKSGDDTEVEELWAEVVAFAQAIAVDHRTEALLSVIGKDGRNFLVQVASTVVGGIILYWILHN